jgi:hypothetical protein
VNSPPMPIYFTDRMAWEKKLWRAGLLWHYCVINSRMTGMPVENAIPAGVFLKDEHPNFTLMEPEGQLGYKIEQLRDFIRNTNYMISYRGINVFISFLMPNE